MCLWYMVPSLPEHLLQLCGRAPSLAGLCFQSQEHLRDGILCGTWQCLMGSWWAGSVSCRGALIPPGSITGLTSEGIYRKSGQNSKTTSLLEVLQRDARCVCLKEGEHQVDDVANTLKRFFRDLGDGLFTRRWAPDWLWATGEPWGLRGGGRRRGVGYLVLCGQFVPFMGWRNMSGLNMFPCAGVSCGGWGVECVCAACPCTNSCSGKGGAEPGETARIPSLTGHLG